MATEGDAAAITLPPPFSLAAYDCVGSINDEAKILATRGAGHGVLDGALVLETPAGLRRVTVGDVHFPVR